MALSKTLFISCPGNISLPNSPRQLIENTAELREFGIENVDGIEVTTVPIKDATITGPAFWNALNRIIERRYHEFSGFVIAADTNALAEAASALMFSIQGLDKPIILTGSNVNVISTESDVDGGSSLPDQRRSNLRLMNLSKSLDLTKNDLPGVYVFYGDSLIPGHRAIHRNPGAYNAFRAFRADCPNDEISTPAFGGRWRQASRRLTFWRKPQPRFLPGFSPNVHPYRADLDFLFQGYSEEEWKHKKPDGIILVSGGRDGLPKKLEDFLSQADDRQCPVAMIAHESMFPFVSMEAAKAAQDRHPSLIVMADINWHCLLPKFQWLLGQNTPFADMRKQMQRNMCGEIITVDGRLEDGVSPRGFVPRVVHRVSALRQLAQLTHAPNV